MKKNKISIFILIIPCIIFSQKTLEDYITEAHHDYDNKKYKRALKKYQYILKKYPKIKDNSDIYFNIGYIYYHKKKYNKSIQIFKQIMESNKNKNLKDNTMHYTTFFMSKIYYQRKIYDSALYYHFLSDTVYSYLSHCGDALEFNRIQSAIYLSDIYQKLNKTDDALKTLLPLIDFNIYDNYIIISRLKKLFIKIPNVKQKFNQALQHIYTKSNNNNSEYLIYYINFLNVEMEIKIKNDDIPSHSADMTQQKIINKIYHSEFYKMIQQIK